jgi:16S rRNA (cytosine967-C5)-methyltransferase
MKSSRQLAIEVLVAAVQKGQPVDQVFDQQQAGHLSGDPRDTQLATAMVYGVLRWQGYLDQVIAGFSSHPLAKMKPLTLAALRVGGYQLLFMDRVPDSAAINETVQALKASGQPKWLTSFANGVLRSLARGKEQVLPVTSREALFLSHPAWLIHRWRQRYGDEVTEAICQANNELPPLVVRVNSRRIGRPEYLQLVADGGIEVRAGTYAPDAIRLIGYRGSVTALPGYAEGLFQVQDEAAQLATLLFGDLAASRYLDGCAGLGGKTSHLAQRMPPGGEVVAVEPHDGRRKLLRENLTRLGIDATIFAGELQAFAKEQPQSFQGILIDAPCSGLGVVGRQPDIRWQRSESDLHRYAERQRGLLDQAATLLASGGVLVYATCSTEPEENDEVVSGFLATHPDFVRADAKAFLPAAAHVLVDSQGCLRTLPHQGLDGFFAARLEKKKRQGAEAQRE